MVNVDLCSYPSEELGILYSTMHGLISVMHGFSSKVDSGRPILSCVPVEIHIPHYPGGRCSSVSPMDHSLAS